jgi:hypothetical protein
MPVHPHHQFSAESRSHPVPISDHGIVGCKQLTNNFGRPGFDFLDIKAPHDDFPARG